MNKLTLLFITLCSVHLNNAMNHGSTEYHNFPVEKTVSGPITKYDFWNKRKQQSFIEYNSETQQYYGESFMDTGRYGQTLTIEYHDQAALKESFENLESTYKSKQKLKTE